MCFYADTAWAVALYVCVKLAQKGSCCHLSEDSLQPIKVNIIGVFAHGIGHLLLSLFPILPESSGLTVYQMHGESSLYQLLGRLVAM